MGTAEDAVSVIEENFEDVPRTTVAEHDVS